MRELEKRPLRILRDVRSGGLTVFRKGEVISPVYSIIRRVAPPPGYAGFNGWFVRRNTTDFYEYSLEEGVDAEAIEE